MCIFVYLSACNTHIASLTTCYVTACPTAHKADYYADSAVTCVCCAGHSRRHQRHIATVCSASFKLRPQPVHLRPDVETTTRNDGKGY